MALTGHAAPEDTAKARAAGFDTLLAKPPSPKKVEEVLQASSEMGAFT